MTRPTPPPLLQCWCPCQLPCSQAQCTLYDQPWNSRTISVSGVLLSGRFSGSCNTPISLELREDLPSLISRHHVLYSWLSLEPKSGFVTVTAPWAPLHPLATTSSVLIWGKGSCDVPPSRTKTRTPAARSIAGWRLTAQLLSENGLGQKEVVPSKVIPCLQGQPASLMQVQKPGPLTYILHNSKEPSQL